MFQDPERVKSQKNTLAFSNFLNEVDAKREVEVQIQGNNITGVLADGKIFLHIHQIIQSWLTNFLQAV